jgi:hypothetical protein
MFSVERIDSHGHLVLGFSLFTELLRGYLICLSSSKDLITYHLIKTLRAPQSL